VPALPLSSTFRVSPWRRITELPLSWVVTIRVWLLRTGSGAAGLAGVALAMATSSAVSSRAGRRHEPRNNIDIVGRWGSA